MLAGSGSGGSSPRQEMALKDQYSYMRFAAMN